jgi:hypothetical protein
MLWLEPIEGSAPRDALRSNGSNHRDFCEIRRTSSPVRGALFGRYSLEARCSIVLVGTNFLHSNKFEDSVTDCPPEPG